MSRDHAAEYKRRRQLQEKRNDGYAALAKLLPGDNIHSVAPSSVNYVDTANALTAAEDKRRRRAAKRAALAK